MSADPEVHESHNPNIIILTSSFPKKDGSHEGGFIFEFAKKIDTPIFRPLVLCPHFPNAPICECWPPLKVFRFPYFFPSRYERLAYGSGMVYNVREHPAILSILPFFIISELIFSLYNIKKYRIILIHTHWLIFQGLIGALLHCFIQIPHVATVHGSDLNILKKYPLLYPIGRFITRNSSLITVNSNYMKQQLLAVSPDCERKTRIIPMGINPSQFMSNSFKDMKKRHMTKHLILSVGRLIDWKGTIFLIEAMPRVLEKFPDAKLIIAGIGPEQETLINKTGELNLGNHIAFLGVVPSIDLPSYFHSANVFVLPSVNLKGKTEGLGVVLLEAMAAGCPVIGSNVGGIPDIIRDGENGFLVPEQNPSKIAEKIVALLSDAMLSERFRMEGYRTIKSRFTWSKVSQQFSESYERVLSEYSRVV